ncbi:MAG: hypothetical protein II441_05855 [Oscillospiraceae bacterium]|nr:hypothetical protein [Oscillospiraceae bacterium]
MDRNSKNLRTLSTLFIIIALCNIATFALALLLRTEVITQLLKAERGIIYIIIAAVACSLISVIEIIIAVKGFQKARGMGVGNGHIGLSWAMLFVTVASLILIGYEVYLGNLQIEVIWQPLANILMIYEFLRFAGILNHDRKKAAKLAAKEAEKAAKEAEAAAKEAEKQETAPVPAAEQKPEEVLPGEPVPEEPAPMSEAPEEPSESVADSEESAASGETGEKKSLFQRIL